jgi:hypothetical protein
VKTTTKVVKSAKKTKTATLANPLFVSRPKSFRIGGDIRVSQTFYLL